MFSPWEFNIDAACEKLLNETTWNRPDDEILPTGGELVELYLDPLANNTPLKEHIRLSSQVTAISRVGFDKLTTEGRDEAQFEIRYLHNGTLTLAHADAVTWGTRSRRAYQLYHARCTRREA